MAVKIKRVTKSTNEINMASISDIVFLLLIFFMVATVFNQELGLPILLPSAAQKQEEIRVKESNVANVVIDANDVVTIEGEPIRINQIKNDLQRRLAANKKLIVILTTDPEADYGTFIAVFDEVRLSAARRVSIKMRKAQG